jgi:AcrR family transcriptional regulator
MGAMAVQESREPLSRERLFAAAVALADAEGLKALTMRRLAADLGVEAMSLYYHVPSKEALLDGVAETVIAEIAAAAERAAAAGGGPNGDGSNRRDPNGDGSNGGGSNRRGPNGGDPNGDGSNGAGPNGGDLNRDGLNGEGGGWRARLRRRFLAAREVVLRHPWAPGLLGSRRTIPAGLLAYYEEVLGTLVDAGFSYRLAHRAIHSFGSMPLGFAQELFSPASAGGSMDTDMAEADVAAIAKTLPHLTAMVASEMHDAADSTLGWCDGQVEFEFTLDLLLNGLERLRP